MIKNSTALPWKSAWVTGASSGIGRDIAIKLAQRGVKVAASARSIERLEDLARAHANIHAFPVDVTSRDQMGETAARILTAFGILDLAILNAGTWEPRRARDYDATAAARSMAVNYLGMANALEPLIPHMIERRDGQLALVGSVAGYRGLPMASAYAPSKAAVISLAEVLRLELAPLGVTVSLVNPGFVNTPMTSVNAFPMPFLIESDDAAERIISGLIRGKFEIAFPLQLVVLLKILRLLPNSLYLRIASRL
ncbi:MAG: SDR family NAD(P)-dependent oxidoreductase [Hyphomicrobiaceae bacterium]